MDLIYRSTRDNSETATASQAILKGLATEGGLFVPDHIPPLDLPLSSLASMDYRQVAYEVMSRFLTDFTSEELKYCIDHAYDDKFDTSSIVEIVEKDGYHGPRFQYIGPMEK